MLTMTMLPQHIQIWELEESGETIILHLWVANCVGSCADGVHLSGRDYQFAEVTNCQPADADNKFASGPLPTGRGRAQQSHRVVVLHGSSERDRAEW